MIMIKNSIFFLIVFCCIVFLFSCEQEKVTYQDCVEEEQAIINNFINDHEVIVLKEYPGNGVFHKNEFVKLENGVYLHVIDSGNGNRPVSGTKIQSFAEGCILGKDSMINFDGFRNNKDLANWPIEFTYNESPFLDQYLLGEGYMGAMKFVGGSSSVSMIVPFAVGSSYQQSVLVPIYFERVDFVFVK